MENKLRNITVNNHKYKWSIRMLDENYVYLKIWDANIKKTPWIQVSYRFDDPWLNFQEMAHAHASEEERNVYQTKPMTPSIISKVIQNAVEQLGLPSENMTCTFYELSTEGKLKLANSN